MKRIVSLLLAVSMVFGMFATVFAGTYSDLTGDNAKYAGAVEALTELKVDGQSVINGYPDGTFGPEKTVTRAELAKMLVVCQGMGSEVEALATKSVFSDVPTTHWAAGFINAAAQSKIIVGYPDGTFQPDKTVSYAEAFTMALRALGYGNVADFEGTWPTSYMLKAVELDLNRDMENVKSDIAATRGNIAILLWNMLRTPMWKVTEESENGGMTLSDSNRQRMLNVKFPDYDYAEEVYVEYVNVTDKDDVLIGILDTDIDGDLYHAGEAQIRNVDISKIVNGMKVTALVKVGKKGEDATYLTLTSENAIVEGLITEISDDGDKITVNGEEYKLSKGVLPEGVELAVDTYVVFEADGKKVNTYEYDNQEGAEYVIKTLPITGTEVEDVKSALRTIKEDMLVIRNGEWVDREEIAEGDVYTKVTDDDGTVYFMVTDERLDVVLDGYTVKSVKGVPSHILTVDDEELRNPLGDDLEGYEGENNDKVVLMETIYNTKAKENKYLGSDVEVVLTYLGTPIILYFGDLDDLNNGGSFFAVVDGIWTGSGRNSSDGIALVGLDGEGADADGVSEGVEYSFKKNAKITEVEEGELDIKTYLENGTPKFVWANFEDDEETIKNLVTIFDGLTSGDESGYKNKYTIAAVSGEVKDGKLGDFKVSSSTVVMTVTPVEDPDSTDEDPLYEGYSVEVTQGLDNKTVVPEGSFVAYDASKPVMRATYVFVAKEAESAEYHYGLVEDYDWELSAGLNYITINGERYEIEEDANKLNEEAEEGFSVAFTENKGKVKLRESWAYLDPAEVDDGMDRLFIIDKDTESDVIVFRGIPVADFSLDLGEDSDDIEDYEDFKVVIITAEADDEGVLEFSSVEEKGEGLLEIPNKPGVRVILPEADDDEEVIVCIVVEGCKDNSRLQSEISEGIFTEVKLTETETTDDGGDDNGDDSGDVTTPESGDGDVTTPESGDGDVTPESGDTIESGDEGRI